MRLLIFKQTTRRTARFPLLLYVIIMGVISSCSTTLDVKSTIHTNQTPKPRLNEKNYTSFDGDTFGYKKWVAKGEEPKTVMIGVHGISGHAGDYANLGEYFLKNKEKVALYAAETRGQGLDPVEARRGDIRSCQELYRDLYTFTGLVRKLHPHAKIVWFGESMGSLIVMHAYNHPRTGELKPDALVIASPIVDVGKKLPPWKHAVARVAAVLFPKYRISLESLSGEHHAVVTKDDIHEEQAAQNPWYIRRYTLRLLLKLGDMADALGEEAPKVDCPVLILHGGKDIFTTDASVTALSKQFPAKPGAIYKYYKESFHLLMYDHEREKIFKDISGWLRSME